MNIRKVWGSSGDQIKNILSLMSSVNSLSSHLHNSLRLEVFPYKSEPDCAKTTKSWWQLKVFFPTADLAKIKKKSVKARFFFLGVRGTFLTGLPFQLTKYNSAAIQTYIQFGAPTLFYLVTF